jgi:hypothetical protein
MKKITLTSLLLFMTSCSGFFYSSAMNYQNQQCFDISNSEDRAACFANASRSYKSYEKDRMGTNQQEQELLR